jgi:hypothetical protein
MPEERGQELKFKSATVPSVYCNHANVSLSYSDVRVYVGELSPNEMFVNPTGKDYGKQEPHFEPKFSLVLTPEFARQLSKALSVGVQQYEAIFGKLRAELTQDQLDQSIESQKEIIASK